MVFSFEIKEINELYLWRLSFFVNSSKNYFSAKRKFRNFSCFIFCNLSNFNFYNRMIEQKKREKNKHLNNLFFPIGINLCCLGCKEEYKCNSIQTSVNEFQSNFLIKKDKKTVEKRQNFFLSQLFCVDKTSLEKIQKRKGRKKWTEKHQKLLKGGLILFGENFEKLHSIIPEFNIRFLKKKINYLYWKKYLFIKTDTINKLEFVSTNIFDNDTEENQSSYSVKKKHSNFNIYQSSEEGNQINSNTNYFFDELLSKQNEEDETSIQKVNLFNTPIKKLKDPFKESPFSNLNLNNSGFKFSLNSNHISPLFFKTKKNKFYSIEKRNGFLNEDWIFSKENF